MYLKCLKYFIKHFQPSDSLGRSQHQFNTVQLVNFTGTWIVVYSDDIGFWIALSKFLDHTFSDNVVWQAAKWLGADDIFNTAVDQLQHLAGQKQAFASLVS